MNERDKALILEFKKRLSSDLERHLKHLIVFGSRVRGEGAEGSDIDVIALVDEKTPDVEKGMEDIAYKVMWDYDFKPIISLKVLVESQFNDALAKGFSFYRHIKQEGISL